MHFSVIREHREFFRKHHWIECDGVISVAELKRLSETIPQVLAERESSASEDAFSKDFIFGHDIWRGAPALKKIILSRNLAEIASELIEEKPIRFGYDTLFPAVFTSFGKNVYASFLQTTPTLKEMSCIQGVLCGAMVCLSGKQEPANTSADSTLFSKIPGNIVFFSPDWPLPLHQIYQNPSFVYLLIVYVKGNAIYLSQPGDPHLHDFKQLGYNFGDRLQEPLHPIVYT
jgi:hypothetical protein